MEYLAKMVFNENELLYPDSLVGADSHTMMINGLGILGWGIFEFFFYLHNNNFCILNNLEIFLLFLYQFINKSLKTKIKIIFHLCKIRSYL